MLAIASKDASAPGGAPGQIDGLALAPAREERAIGADGADLPIATPTRRSAIVFSDVR